MSLPLQLPDPWSAPPAGGTARSCPRTPQEAADALAAACAQGRSVHVRGLGSRRWTPAPSDGLLLTTALDRVIAYEPGDQTITAEAGIGLAALDALLAAEGQWLPVQQRGGAGTLGGLLAVAADGACDLLFGRVRERVLGAAVALPDGTVAHGRGRVVKNVAGYDLPRLLVGSRGCLGAVVQATLKVEPRPARRAAGVTRCRSLAAAYEAAELVLDSGLQPAFVDVLAGTAAGDAEARLAIGWCGSAARVDGQRLALEELLASRGLRDGERLSGPAHDALLARLDDPAAEARAPESGEPRGCVLRVHALASELPALLDAVLALARESSVTAALDARPGNGLLFVALGAGPASGSGAGAPGATEATRTLLVARAVLERVRRVGSASVLASAGLAFTAREAWGPAPPGQFLLERVKAACDPTGVLGPLPGAPTESPTGMLNVAEGA